MAKTTINRRNIATVNSNGAVPKPDIPPDIAMSGVEEMVTLATLEIDYSYQRCLKPYHKRIAANWNPQAAGRLVVGRRKDGVKSLIDGQQRQQAMLSKGITSWMALVIDSNGPEHEAAIYNILNGGDGTRKGQTAKEQFKAQLIANDPTALKAKEIVEGCGLTLESRRRDHVWPQVQCIKTVYDGIKNHGESAVRAAFQVILRSWPEQVVALEHSIVKTMFAIVLQPNINLDLLVSKLQETSPMAII